MTEQRPGREEPSLEACRGRSEKGPGLDRLGDLLPSGFANAASQTGGACRVGDDVRQRLAAVWADVVGPEVAANARPVQLRQGRLVVATSSSAWAQTLQLMSPMVVTRLNERLGEGSLEKAIFRHAGWETVGPTAGLLEGDRKGSGEKKPASAAGRRNARPADLPAEEIGSSGEQALLPDEDVATGAGPRPEARGESGREDLSEDLSADERQALADLEKLPLASSVKVSIRDAMQAGFARARKDSGRS